MMGQGAGWCLDLGCGTGPHRGGRGFSADQLRVAARRGHPLLRDDGAALPFAGGVFSAAVILWVSTDVDDFGVVLREVSRVLPPGGLLVFYGVHPCFNGPCVEARRIGRASHVPPGGVARGGRVVENGIRGRIGMRHLPLSELIKAFIGGGFLLDRVAEPGPHAIAIRARRLDRQLPNALFVAEFGFRRLIQVRGKLLGGTGKPGRSSRTRRATACLGNAGLAQPPTPRPPTGGRPEDGKPPSGKPTIVCWCWKTGGSHIRPKLGHPAKRTAL